MGRYGIYWRADHGGVVWRLEIIDDDACCLRHGWLRRKSRVANGPEGSVSLDFLGRLRARPSPRAHELDRRSLGTRPIVVQIWGVC